MPQPKRLAVQSTVDRRGNVKRYENGMPQPELKRVAKGINSWYQIMFYRKEA